MREFVEMIESAAKKEMRVEEFKEVALIIYNPNIFIASLRSFEISEEETREQKLTVCMN